MAESVSLISQKIEWKVKHFWSVETLESDMFNFCGSVCKLRLLRLGTEKGEFFYMSISRFCLNETRLNEEIRLKTFIEDRNKQPLFSLERIGRCENMELWWQYIPVLRKNKEKILTDDVVTFVCELITEAESKGKIKKEVSTQTALSIETVTNLECLSREVHHLLDDNLLSDVTLKCGDRTIRAHRKILSARSEEFLAILRNDMAESKTGIIEISNMEPSTLEQLVQYIYSGIVPELSADRAQRLYAAADKYAIESLKTLCGNFMKENLTEENAYSFLALADAHGDKDLKDVVLSFVVNSDLLRDEENWFGFHKKYPKVAAEVLYYAFKEKCFPK